MNTPLSDGDRDTEEGRRTAAALLSSLRYDGTVNQEDHQVQSQTPYCRLCRCLLRSVTECVLLIPKLVCKMTMGKTHLATATDTRYATDVKFNNGLNSGQLVMRV